MTVFCFPIEIRTNYNFILCRSIKEEKPDMTTAHFIDVFVNTFTSLNMPAKNFIVLGYKIDYFKKLFIFPFFFDSKCIQILKYGRLPVNL